MMKKSARTAVTAILICISLLCLPACGRSDEQKEESQKKAESEQKESDAGMEDMPEQVQEEDKILVAYTADVEDLAGILEGKTGGDKFVIQDGTVYPQSFEEYNIIYLGYQVSGESIPDKIQSFLNGNDFAGRTVIPFCIHDGAGLGSSVYDIGNLCPDSKITAGLAVSRSELADAEEEVTFWLQTLDMR